MVFFRRVVRYRPRMVPPLGRLCVLGGGLLWVAGRAWVSVNIYEAIGLVEVVGGGATVLVVHDDPAGLERTRETLFAVALEYGDYPVVRRSGFLEIGVGVARFVSALELRSILPADMEIVTFGGAVVPEHIRSENFVVDY